MQDRLWPLSKSYTVQDEWDVPMEAYAHQVFNAWSRHDSIASSGKRMQVQQGARSLLARSRQSKLTASGSGVLRYEPTGYQIDGADFTKFFQEAHANMNVTGEQTDPRHECPSFNPAGLVEAGMRMDLLLP